MEQRDQDYARHLAKESDDIVVFSIRRDTNCARCNKAMSDGSFLTLRENQPLCMECANLADLAFLPSGDPAVTRRAGKHSSRKAVVVRWARARKRYERQGTLVEQSAIDRAREESAADAAIREAKNKKAAAKREIEDRQYLAAFAAELKRLFPGCPPEEAEQIALHACEKHSGRVGRSASAKELDPDKIRLAVIAHIRHVHTGYDGFFDINVPKHDARRMVQAKIQRILAKWEAASSNS
jgi:hypothetical protein